MIEKLPTVGNKSLAYESAALKMNCSAATRAGCLYQNSNDTPVSAGYTDLIGTEMGCRRRVPPSPVKYVSLKKTEFGVDGHGLPCVILPPKMAKGAVAVFVVKYSGWYPAIV